MNALQLFRAGNDYLEIAAHFTTTEAVVERVIDRLRHAERLEDRQAAAQIKMDAVSMLKRHKREGVKRARLAEIRRAHA